MEERQYKQDVDGFEEVTDALMDMMNSYPGLDTDEHFDFSTVPVDDGLAVIASSGSFIVDEKESITGHVKQFCAYPFVIVNRVSGLSQKRKIAVKEWMDTIAKWLTRQEVSIHGKKYKLEWPVLIGDRKITNIERQSPSYLESINDDKSENWVMELMLKYRNEFDR